MASSSQKRLKSTDDVETFFRSFTSKNWLQVCIPVESVDKDKSEVTYQCPNTECKSKKKLINLTRLRTKRMDTQISSNI